jgi:hypothetical protein
LFLEKKDNIIHEYNYLRDNFVLKIDNDFISYDFLFFSMDKNEVELNLINFIKEKKIKDYEFYLRLSVCNKFNKLFSFLLDQEIKIDSDLYFDLYYYLRGKKNKKYLLRENELLLFKEMLNKLLLNNSVKFKKTSLRVKKLRKNIYNKRIYFLTNELDNLVLLLKVDYDFIHFNKFFEKNFKSITWISDFIKMINGLRKNDILRQKLDPYIHNNEYRNIIKKCYSSSLSIDCFNELDNLEKKMVLDISSELRKNIIRYDTWNDFFTKKRENIYNRICNSQSKKLCEDEIKGYYHRFNSGYEPKKICIIKGYIDLIINYLKNYENTSYNSLIYFNILNKLNYIILYSKDYKGNRQFEESLIELFKYLAYRKNKVNNKYFNSKIILLYKKMNSKKYELPFSCMDDLVNKKYIDLFIFHVNKRYDTTFENFLFKINKIKNDIEKKRNITFRYNNKKKVKLKDYLFELDFLESKIKSKEFQRTIFFKNLYIKHIEHKLKNNEYIGTELSNSPVCHDYIYINLSLDLYKVKFLITKSSLNKTYNDLKKEYIDLIRENLDFLDSYEKRNLYFELFLTPNKNKEINDLFDIMTPEFKLMNYEYWLINNKITVDDSVYFYKEFREGFKKTKTEFYNYLNQENLSNIINNETSSIKRILFNKDIYGNRLFSIKNFFYYYLTLEIKNIDYRRSLLEKFKNQYSYDNDYFNIFDFKFNYKILFKYGLTEKDLLRITKKYFKDKKVDHNIRSYLNLFKEIHESLMILFNNEDKLQEIGFSLFNRKREKNILDIHTKLYDLCYLLSFKSQKLLLPEDQYMVIDGFCSLDKKFRIEVPKSTKELYGFSVDMKNCVKGYIDSINRKKVVIYNIFYQEKPYINISIRDNKVSEIKQKFNKPVTDEENQYFRDVLLKANILK